ncbi:hypothetical protein [Kitasatospora sp. DSM 101779]|uniref:8-oxoguanine DNA glycosylase OGG fold protein n=1 Tax=Kitasatospora sp. DSM 101779 TaxID=2853165 RepID=UPI003988818B
MHKGVSTSKQAVADRLDAAGSRQAGCRAPTRTARPAPPPAVQRRSDGPRTCARLTGTSPGSSRIRGCARRWPGPRRALTSEGAVAAYRRPDGAVPGLGRAFFTTFLHFAGLAREGAVPGPLPLVLDSRVAAARRALALPAGLAAGAPGTAAVAPVDAVDRPLDAAPPPRPPGPDAHRHRVHLDRMHTAAAHMAPGCPDRPAGRSGLLGPALFRAPGGPHPPEPRAPTFTPRAQLLHGCHRAAAGGGTGCGPGAGWR